MKKLFFLLMLFPALCLSQIKQVEDVNPELIGKVGPKKAPHVGLYKLEDVYYFEYNDVKFTHIDSFKKITFLNEDNTLDSLYKLIKENIENPPKEDIKLEFPNNYVWLEFTKNMGIVSVRFYDKNRKTDIEGLTIWMTKKQIDKLFGKK